MQKEMERRLLMTPHLEYEDDKDAVQVAVTTMAFKNRKMINLLRERGSYIKDEQWEKQRECEDRIN